MHQKAGKQILVTHEIQIVFQCLYSKSPLTVYSVEATETGHSVSHQVKEPTDFRRVVCMWMIG